VTATDSVQRPRFPFGHQASAHQPGQAERGWAVFSRVFKRGILNVMDVPPTTKIFARRFSSTRFNRPSFFATAPTFRQYKPRFLKMPVRALLLSIGQLGFSPPPPPLAHPTNNSSCIVLTGMISSRLSHAFDECFPAPFCRDGGRLTSVRKVSVSSAVAS